MYDIQHEPTRLKFKDISTVVVATMALVSPGELFKL